VGAEPGDYVMLAMTDTGVGMDEEVLAHIFEPYFTTKERGRGTGLGLATVYGIVKQSGGHLWAYSEPGQGTTLKVYLPRAQADEEKEGLQQVSSASGVPQGRGETVLVIEDDPVVRDAACKALQANSYRVLEAADAGQAMEIAMREDTIDLLFTDVIMRGKNGRQIAEELSAVHPEMKVLYTSGYTDNVIAHHGVLEEGFLLLQKPYAPSSLVKKVREVLDS